MKIQLTLLKCLSLILGISPFFILPCAFASSASSTAPPAGSSPIAPSTPAATGLPSTAESPMGSPASAPVSGEYSPESREYHLKAAFLRYVAKFVEWPISTLPESTITICILGLVPSYEALNSLNGKDANTRSIVVTKIIDLNEAKVGQCQILFVSKTEEDNIKQIVDHTKDQPILTFGDMENFAQKGGNMNFYIANNRLAIMINPPTVEKSQLKISPRMLRLVTIVPPV